MKKWLALILALILLPLLPAALAEDDVEANYEGSWVSLGSSGYQCYLPIQWAAAAKKGDECFATASKNPAMRLGVISEENQLTIESILATLASREGNSGVRVVSYNGRTFITYKASDGALGAVTLSGDGSRAFWFTFTSGDSGLFAKILNSFAPNQ